MKLKILGAALLALAATSAFAVTNASGTAAGHFTHEGLTNNAIITGHEGTGTAHELEFNRLQAGSHATAGAAGDGIVCGTSEYTGKVEAKTVTSIQLFPIYKNCKTTDGTSVTIDTNDCSYTFFSQGARAHGTVTVDCLAGKAIEITHPNCVIKVPAQTTITDGINYKTVVEGKHALTAEVTANTITGHFESGLCIFLGTNWKFEMKGSVTVKGFEYLEGNATEHTLKEGAQIPITST
jgi:hypothetical protein